MSPPFLHRRAARGAEHMGHYPAPFDAEKLSAGHDLGRAAGSRRLGAWEERIPPGVRTSFTHAHLREEELIYVLAGHPTLRWIEVGAEPQEIELEPGDFIAFPAGTGIAHTFWNRGTTDAVILAVGERCTGERTAYPEDTAYQAWRDAQRPQRGWPDVAGPTGVGRWPAVRIETARLVLRPWTSADTPDLWALLVANQAHLGRFLDWARVAPTLDEQLDVVRGFEASFAQGKDLVYGLFLPDGRPIGGAGFHPRVGRHAIEIGYWIDHAHQGQGYVTEVTATLTRLAIEIKGFQAVEIHCDPRNTRSAAVPRRLGFSLVGTLPGRTIDAEGHPADTEVYSLMAHAWPGSPGSTHTSRAFDALGRRLL